MAPRRALARRAARLLGYWRSETRTIRQGLVALALSTAAGFVAGLILAHLTDTLAALPGLLILIPAAVGMKGTIFGAIGARLGTASAAGMLDDRPAARRRAAPERPGRGPHDLLLVGVARGAGARRRRTRAASRRSRSGTCWSSRSIGGAIGSVVILAITVMFSAASTRAGLGPRLGLDADGHRARRHDHACRACSSRRSCVRNDDGVGGRRGDRDRRRRSRSPIRSYTVPDPAVRRIVVEMTATIVLTPILDVMAGALLRANEARLARRAGGARGDPAVRLAGGRARWDLLVADHLEAAARCDHPARPARGCPPSSTRRSSVLQSAATFTLIGVDRVGSGHARRASRDALGPER